MGKARVNKHLVVEPIVTGQLKKRVDDHANITFSGFQGHCIQTWDVVQETILVADCYSNSGMLRMTDLPHS